jgi:hypothetical protein
MAPKRSRAPGGGAPPWSDSGRMPVAITPARGCGTTGPRRGPPSDA